MADTPATTNEAVSIANKVTRFAITVGVTAAEIAAKTALPILGAPVLSQIVDFIIGKMGDFLYVFFAEHETIMIINFQTAEQKNAYMDSVAKLQAAQLSGDQKAHDEALEKAKEALANLAHWNGTASP